jgi:thiamine-phosphate pyrophosphorylase
MHSAALLTGSDAREQLARARVMLLFTPALCGDREPLAVLAAALPFVDAVQVRVKPAGALAATPAQAREIWEWSRRILDLARTGGTKPFVLLVDDRADVARALAGEGVAGVHLGQDDMPCALAREYLGPEALIGLSTHDMAQVAGAA